VRKKKTLTLPKLFSFYFWDTDIKKLDVEEKAQFVIQRFLEIGDLKAVRWIVKNFPRRQIIMTIKKRRGFSRRTLNFWSSFFKIPPKEILCLQKPYRQQQKIHWPY